MEAQRNQTRSQQNLSALGEGLLTNFEKEKKNGSFPNLASSNVDLPTEAKRRRIMGEDASIASTVSSQVSSRSHSPTFSECLDDSFLSTPGNSPSATLKEKFRRKYGKYELNIDQILMDKDISEACKSPEEEEDIGDNTKVSLTEFRQQYKELSEWLNQVQKVTQTTIGTLSASERYLAQSQHEELLLQSAPRFKLFNDYAVQLLQRFPGLRQEIDERVHILKSQWNILEQAVSSKAMWQNTETMFKDLECDLLQFGKWLNETETKLFSLGLRPQSTDEEVHKSLVDHQVLQKDIESHSRYINAILRLSERLHDEFEDSPDHDYFLLEEKANKLQQRWHETWLLSLECQCKLENALKNKKASISPQTFLTGWIPQSYHKNYDNLESSLGSDDSLILLNRGADLADSPPLDYSCSLSTSGDTSGKDSAVVSEVEIKMSSECSDSDLDMLRKTRLKSENRDVGYSSGASVSPLPNGHTSTESDCDDIKKLIEKVDCLVGEKPKSPKRQRKLESPSKQRPPYSSCDASSEESDASAEEFSTASDDADGLFDSVLGLDYNSDASLNQNLPKLCSTVKLRQARRKKKDRPWSAIQSMDLDNVDLVELSKSESAIDRLKDSSDASETPRRHLHSSSATLPRAGAKRKLYEPVQIEETVSDTESSTCEEYETARSDVSISEDDENIVSTASFSEPTWDNYHQVYLSLGEEEEQPLTWSPLEEDLEFDEEFSIHQNSSIVKEAIEKRKLKTRPKLISQGSRHGYDSDSDIEELCYLIEESAHQLKIADTHLKKKCKDFVGSGIDINTNRYAEIIATCQTNIKCLQNVLHHLDTTNDTTEEETEKIKDLLYQWEKLYAFATEQQAQSQQLSHMNRCLEEVVSELNLCEVGTHAGSYSNIREVELCLISTQTKLESLPCLYGKLEDLKLKSSAFQMEHPAINLQHFVQEQERARTSLMATEEMLHKRYPELNQMFSVWSEYNQVKQEIDTLLMEKLNCTAAGVQQDQVDTASEIQTLSESLRMCSEKCWKLQSLRGQLMNVVSDRTKAELTNDVADFQDRLTEVEKQYRTLLWSVENNSANTEEQTYVSRETVAQTQASLESSPASSPSSSSSAPSSWYSSRYVKAAGAFMIFGIAYLYDPDTIKRLGDLTFTLTPELRYVNGPPPM